MIRVTVELHAWLQYWHITAHPIYLGGKLFDSIENL